MEKVTLDIELTKQQALDLAQFCKRVGFGEFRANSVDEHEAYRMRDAQYKVYQALRDQGFDPR